MAMGLKTNVDFKEQTQIAQYVSDFVIESARLVIEVDGCYFHSCSACGVTRPEADIRDARKEQTLVALGYRVLRVRGHEILQDTQSVVDQISTLVGRSSTNVQESPK